MAEPSQQGVDAVLGAGRKAMRRRALFLLLIALGLWSALQGGTLPWAAAPEVAGWSIMPGLGGRF